jgi:CRISPR-associated protein Cas1
METMHQISRADNRNPILFVQHSKIHIDDNNIRIINKLEDVSVSPNNFNALLLGPGTSITHEAVKLLSHYHVNIQWVSDEILHAYATSNESRKSRNVLRQVRLMCDDKKRIAVAQKMYVLRFGEEAKTESIEKLRELEGLRVKNEYERIAKETGIEWHGRSYVPSNKEASDLPNSLLSLANSYLYGVCCSVIVQLGYSPIFGFVHTGNMMSFVFDVADFYKTRLIVPLVFETSAMMTNDYRLLLRSSIIKMFENEKIVQQIEKDIDNVLDISLEEMETKSGWWKK